MYNHIIEKPEQTEESLMQETYDFVVKKLAKQGRPSMSAEHDEELPICRYRGPNGTKCAAGWLIKDEEYSEEMEGCVISAIAFDLSEHNPKIWGSKRFVDFVYELQRSHDELNNWTSLEKWREAFIRPAKIFGLDPIEAQAASFDPLLPKEFF